MEIARLTHLVIGCAFRVHNTLGTGYVEKVYENALRVALEEQGVRVRQQVPIQVTFLSHVVGDYVVDLFVEEMLVTEVKAVRAIAPEHEVQLVNYLTAMCIEDGLLLNFGPSVEVRRKYRTYREGAGKPARANTD